MLSLQELKDYAYDVSNGTRTIKRLSSGEEQGRKAGGRRNVEATLVAGAEAGADSQNQSADERQRQENALKNYAQTEGIWYADYENYFGIKIAEGAEAIIFGNDSDIITKVNDLAFHETPLEFFDRIALHNFLFPEAPYTLIGFTERNDTGNFAVIVEQLFVTAMRGATRAEVRSEMQRRGFRSIDGNDYIVQDLHPGNVLLTPDGILRSSTRFCI